jgi:hypothetical protein
VPHVRRELPDPRLLAEGVQNLIHKSDKPEHQWICETTARIGEWRSKSRTTYMRWALTINGLCVAVERYQDWPDDKRFHVRSIRFPRGRIEPVVLAEWTGAEAAANHRETTTLMSSYGISDLFGVLEEIVFAAYRIFLDHNPQALLRGPEFNELRQLRARAKEDATAREEWHAQWNDRVEKWQRNRLYDGLGAVFLSFMRDAGLQKPHWYQHSTPETWAETIGGIGELRNLITHGVGTVSRKLAEFSAKPTSMTFDFKEGEPLDVKLMHLMGVDAFIDQLLTALNASLIERAVGPKPELRMLLRT